MQRNRNQARSGLIPALALISATGVASLVLGLPRIGSANPKASDADKVCMPVWGKLQVQAEPADVPCDAPAGLCTAGQFTGVLHGTYEFRLAAEVAAPVPGIQYFHGTSQVRLPGGATLVGADTGTIDVDPDRFGNFISLITFTQGTGYLAGATGQITWRGQLDFLGGAIGTYKGRLCLGD